MGLRKVVYSSLWRAVLVLVFILVPLTVRCLAQHEPRTLHRHVPSVVSNGQAKLVDTLPAKQQLALSIILPLRNQAELTNLLGELYNSSSTKYRHFLSVEEFTDEFGPTQQDYDSVIEWAKTQGLTIQSGSKNRMVVDVSGTVAQVNAALDVSMNVYQDPNGKRTFYASDREPTLSGTVPVAHIGGLNNYSIPQPMVKRSKNASPIADVTGSGPGGYYIGSDMRAAYYGGTLLTGAGQSVGVLEFAGYRLSDVNLTFNGAGQSYNVPINNVLLDGASAAAGSDDTEEVLDIVQAIGMAPGLSQVRVYIGTSDVDIFNKMATENICKELSVSWSWAPDDPTTDDAIFQEFAAQGQSIFVASGDYGAYDLSVSPYFYPAEDEYVTSVGATHLTTNYGGGPWVLETAWNTNGYGSGGGVSPDGIALPSWQQGIATWPNGGSNSLRNVPDVAMEGDNDNFYCDLGGCSGGAGGTSFAAPRWAGFMALVDQQAKEVGSAPSGGLGFINPSLYSIGKGPSFSADFHDVIDGNNDTANQQVWFNALPGFDLVTGWGSPNGQNLIDAMAGTVVPGFWLTTTPSALSVYQGTSGSAVVSVTDAGGFGGNVSLTASGLPTGVSAVFSPTSTTGTSELTLTANSSATVGTATVTINGTSGTLTAATQLVLTINTPPTPPPPVGTFGSVNVRATSSAMALTLTIKTAATLSNIGVLTNGSPNLDFMNAGGGTCATGTKYKAGATCTVKVAFSPKYPGTRYGAVALTDKYGNPLATTTYLQGVGVGPQSTFNPGSEKIIGTGFVSPQGVATRGDGSIYVVTYGNGATHGALYLETLANGSYSQTQLSCTFSTPAAVALDGGGTIYVADPGNSQVYKVTTANGTCTQAAIGSGFSQPSGVAVDGSGNVYIAAKGSAAVYKEALQTNGTYVQATVGSGWVTPLGVAVDGNGNVYVADSGIPGVFMEAPSGGNYTQSRVDQGWTAPSGIAVDGAAGIYVSDTGNTLYEGGLVAAGVYKEVASGGTYIQTPISAGWTSPSGLAVDATGNVEVADGSRGVYKEDLTDPPQLTFANVPTGTSSSDSPKAVTVSNIGTAALIFSAVSYPADFPESAVGSADCTATTKLNAGQTCTLTINFLPTTALAGKSSLLLSESVSITTNTLNVAGTRQAVSVTGTEVLPTGSVNLDVSANPSTAGSSIVFTATVGGSVGGPVPTGTVTFYNGTAPLSGAISLTNAVATYSTSSLTPGTYVISASYSGNSTYAASSSNTINESILAAAGTAPIGNTDLGTLNVGSTSSPIPLTITFTQSETLGSIAVLTEGAPNLDFSNSGGGTCVVGNTYSANAACTINVKFSPKYSGVRNGAVVLSDNNGNVIGTGYLEGTGVAPQTEFSPGTLASVSPNFSYPHGVATDGGGRVYVADLGGGVGGWSEGISAGTISGGIYFAGILVTGFAGPYGVAVDAAGNIYVADSGSNAIHKETPVNGSYVQTIIGYGFISLRGVAVDGKGNIYVADYGNGVAPGAVYKETLSNGGYTESQIGGTFVSPQSIAVDGNGDIFVADSANGAGTAAVYKLTPSSGTYIQTSIGSGWVTPTGVAADGNGNVFVTDNDYDLGEGFVAEEAPQPDGTYNQTIIVDSTSVPHPGGIAVDGRGNRYITDDLTGNIYQQDVADAPSLSFVATQQGKTSSDSPKIVSVQNAGNAALTFSLLSYPPDFPEMPGVPTDCRVQSSLGSGASCTLSINFEPGTPLSNGQSQSLAESVTITSNSLGSSTQNIAVAGTDAAPGVSVILTAPANVFIAGDTATFTATVTGQSGLPLPTGTVTFYSENQFTFTTTTMGTATLSSSGSATFSTNSLAMGVYGISATYSGDQNYPSLTSSLFAVNINAASTFGTQSIGRSSIIPVTVSFSSNTTLGGIAVLTDGIQNLDFTNAGSGTCTIGSLYSSGSSCIVNVSFTPRFAGARHGAVVLSDNSGKLIQEMYLSGTGVGPQVAYQPAASTSVFAEPSAPCDQVVDSNGDIYVSLSTSGACGPILKWTPNNGTYTQSTVPSSTLSGQISLAVDGAGNVYIADTNNNRILKENLLNGVYAESVVGSGLSLPRLINVDGHGNIYFVGQYNNGYATYQFVYEETPSSSGGYTQATVVASNFFQNPIGLKVDDEGYIYIDEHDVYTDYFEDWVASIPPGTTNTIEEYVNVRDENVKLEFIDANGNPYISQPTGSYKYVLQGDGYVTAIPIPYDGWGMDGSGNLYRTVGNVVTKVNFASPPSLRFAQTVVGSKSSDSPKLATLENVGNAPLAFSVPNSGTNPSVSTNFALDASSTCPQISASGSPSSLAMNNSCTYAVNFSPSTTGTINGSVIASDNALNAVGGTQTIPLSGSGASGGAGMVVLTMGPSGVLQGVVVPNDTPAGAGSPGTVWVDTVHHTFIQGGVYLQLDSQGNPTCNLYSSTQLAARFPSHLGTLVFSTEQYYIRGCGTTLFPFQVARYTWGADPSVEQDPFTLEYSTQDRASSNDYQFTADLARITVTPLNSTSCTGQSQPSGTVTLANPPAGSSSFKWQITGGNAQVHFLNGQQQISSTNNSVPIDFPAGANFSITVLVTNTSSLQYGPTPYSPAPPPMLSITKLQYSNSQDVWQDSPSNPAPVAVSRTIWTATSSPLPSVFVSGDKINGSATFTISPPLAAPLPGTRIEGSLGNNLGLLAGCVDIPEGATSVSVPLAGDTAFPSSETEHYSPLSAHWSFSPSGQACSSPGAQCRPAGSTSSEVYVTLAQPSGLSESVMPLTAVKLAIGNGGATTQTDAFNETWAQFAGPANVTAWDNQRKLYYYQQGVGFFSCALNSVGLLTQPNGSGQCGAWQHLFLDSLAVNGIIGSQTSITTVDGSLFLVKDWNYGAPSSPSTPPYYWRETFPLENGNCCGMVPVSLVSGDLTSLSTLYGQNTAPPSEKLFARHFIVEAPAGLSVGGPYFDPSYGVTYQNNCDFENKAVAGYAVLAGQPNPPTQVIAVRQPTGSCNISFSN
jgi:hypothetical protein